MAEEGEDLNMEDQYSWLLASADQMPYPEPNPLDAESIGVQIDTDDHSMLHQPLTVGDSVPQQEQQQHEQLPKTSGGSSTSNTTTTTTSSTSTSASNSKPSHSQGRGKTPRSNNNTTAGKRRGAASTNKKEEKSSKRAKHSREDVLERNRRSARECRERKKERVTLLEDRVKRLETENMQLRVQLRVGRETDATETAEKWRITNLLGEMIKEDKPDDVIEETIQMFTERYADYGKERRVACRYHLDYLEKLLVPTQVRD